MKPTLPLSLVAFLATNSLAQSWTLTSAPLTNWGALACSADGTRIAAAAGGWKTGPAPYPSTGPVYLSTNSGLGWTLSGSPKTNWSALASSADGARLYGTLYQYFLPYPIYSSSDSGV